MAGDRVLVTGISGFIGKHVAAEFLRAGYRVRGTVRNPRRADEVRAAMRTADADPGRLEFAVADLGADAGWVEAVRDCRFVAHTASPFPSRIARDRDALVPVARGGTIRVLDAAREAGVERVVLTSSVAAIYYGHGRGKDLFTEGDWTRTDDRSVTAYAVSKTEAERAGWERLKDSATRLATINPALVLGPPLDAHAGTSVKIVADLMRGRLRFVPDITLGVVDVRDVALAHREAMERSDAAGRRFILSAGSLSLLEMGEVLRAWDPGLAGKLPRARLPDVAVRLAALFQPAARAAVPELGRRKRLDTSAARSVLGIRFRSAKESLLATAETLRRLHNHAHSSPTHPQ